MFRLFKYLILIAPGLFLTGCVVGQHGYIHNRKEAYLQSKTLPTIRVPKNLQTAKTETAYPIPNGKDFSQHTAPSLIPPGNNDELTTTKQSHKTIVASKLELGEGGDGFPVLQVPADYQTTWKKVIALLPGQGYQIIGSDDKTGVVEVKSLTKNNKTTQIYQLIISQSKSASLISVKDQAGDAVSMTASKKILLRLKDQLGK